MPTRLLGLIVLALLLPANAARGANELKPKETYGVIVGVLEWEHPGLSSFSKRHRKDQELHDLLVERGVPPANLSLLLDKQATLANIHKALYDIAARAKPGSTLLFYYAGHGGMLDSGQDTCFYNHDYSPKPPLKPALKLSEVAAILKKDFKGERVLLMADCCHSGGLKSVAAELAKAKIKAASVTSADASNLSCGNWTFTQAVLDGLRGDPLIDANGDGTITLGELIGEVSAAMKFREFQMFGHSHHGIDVDFRLARVNGTRKLTAGPKGGFRVGEYVYASDKGKRRPARVVGFGEGKYDIEFYDYSDKRVVKLAGERLEPIRFKTYKTDQELQVMWGGKPWKAKVVKVNGDFHFITYPGWGPEWNEWVLSDRIVDNLAAKQRVEVNWKGHWYPAVILKEKDGKYHIHYLDYDESWDEWVGKDRIRFKKP